MRPGPTFESPVSSSALAAAAGGPVALVHPTTTGPHSAWHSPVPYLFGGLAAMLGLIAFALLILACSYWKLSGYLEGGIDGNGNNENSSQTGDQKSVEAVVKIAPECFEPRVVVIMAGDEKPTFLATPATSKASSFNDDNNSSSCSSNDSSSSTRSVVDDDDAEKNNEMKNGKQEVSQESMSAQV